MKIGRNDKCPCGSGVKYKKCHLGRPLQVLPEPFRGRSIKERNIILLDQIGEIFFGKGENWEEMRASLTEDKVKELYKVIGDLWPPQTDITPLLPKPDNTLRGLYMGDTKPQSILQNIVRYSLYTDEVLVVSPFLAPYTMREKFSPIVNPRQYRQDTLELIFFANALAPWIKAGIVNMIPNPMDFDFSFRKQIYSMAEDRYAANTEQYDKDIKEFADAETDAELKRLYMRMPREALARRLKAKEPNITEEKINEAVAFWVKKRREDPLLLDEEMSTEPEMRIGRMSANLELGLFIGQATGSYLYTNRHFQWKEIMSAQQTSDDSDLWSPLTRAFQSLDFRFLDSVDARFAYELKGEGRLESFRNYLRRIWRKVEENNSTSQANSAAREFGDELHEEYGKAKEDWAKIDKSILTWVSGGTGLPSILSVLATGTLNPIIPAAGFAITGVGKLLEARYKRSAFRANVPMAVLLDLEKKNKIFK